MDKRPIGVFDSGLGGLTVVRELRKILENENIVYFGDTGRVPYGTKSPNTIISYAMQDIEFLKKQNVKMVVAACNTVTAMLTPEMIENFDFLYAGVLIPAVKAAISATKNKKIGVIGTSATIKSSAYINTIHQYDASIQVVAKACPLFVPLVENGYFNKDNKIARLVAEEYLQPFIEEKTDTLILGCTHYPYLYDIIKSILGDEVTLIDSGRETAFKVKELLTTQNMLNNSDTLGECVYYVSDSVETFTDLATIFLNTDIHGDVYKVSI